MSEPSHNGDSEAVQPLEIPAVPQQLYGLLGNLPDMDMENIAASYWRLADLYGPIYSLNIGGKTSLIISNHELIQDAIDDSRFRKSVEAALLKVRDSLGDGLFTAHHYEPNWAKAHRILMPVFGPISIRKMFEKQLDIASQLILKWDRMGPNHRILAADDFTRLAFDTIAYCAYSYRMNDFYSEKMHPFADQMTYTLIEAGKRYARPALIDRLHYFENQKYWNDINAMHALCDEIIQDRIENPQPDNSDLLNVMLNQEDPETHEKLSAVNVRYQMATFLVAGHETTSGTLTFMFLNLLRHPDKYIKVQKEVDEVLGDDAITVKHISKLIYLDACVKETLRYLGPIGLLRREPVRDGLLLGGKYRVPDGAKVTVNLRGLHHDPTVWGDDCDEFKPERMIPFNPVKGSFHPFGAGARACIGRAFAEQEIMIVAALILQRFQVELADPDYELTLKATLTIKPDNLYLKVRRRPGKSDKVGLEGGHAPTATTEAKRTTAEQTNGDTKKPGLTVLYGTNAGTCKAYAEDLMAEAPQFHVTMRTMDSGTENLPTDQPVVIITPSYEGVPPDNAKKFVSWLESAAGSGSSELIKGVRYTVFGVGNSDWIDTYHKVPKVVDACLAKLGAERIMEAGFVDVKTDPAGPWEEFVDKLMEKLGESGISSGARQEITATITAPESSEALMGAKVLDGVVVKNIDLADDSVGPPKKHIEIELPEGVTYKSGDYLAILPFNHSDVVRRVIRRFKLKSDAQVSIAGTNKKYLVTPTPISVFDMLSSRVELNTPITRRQLARLGEATQDAKEKAAIERVAQDEAAYSTEVLAKRSSVLDILEDNLSCEVSFAGYLDMLQALAFRQYSVSSSPLSPNNFGADKLTVSLTYDVHTGNEIANPQREFHGVASSFLARLTPGSHINCAVKSTNAAFHLPKDNSVPIIMIAAGTGLAPMRGFIQERAALAHARGTSPGKALFYFGCRDFEKDYIYKQELQHWEEAGIVQMRPAFSKRAPPESEKNWKYAYERIWDERAEIAELFSKGAKIFLCGSASKLAKSTTDTLKTIYKEKTGCSDEEANVWLEKNKENRYVTDVFG